MPSNEVMYLQADGRLADPRAQVLSRAKLEAAQISKVSIIAGDDIARAPISESGQLSPDEVYRDPENEHVTYALPRYSLETIAGAAPLQVRLELTNDGSAASIGRLWLRVRGALAATAARLPHEATLGLRYLAREASNAPDAMSTWKVLRFDEVTSQADGSVEAVLRLATLNEFDTLHFALRDQPSRCELTVQCSATLAVLRNYRRKLVPFETPPVIEIPEAVPAAVSGRVVSATKLIGVAPPVASSQLKAAIVKPDMARAEKLQVAALRPELLQRVSVKTELLEIAQPKLVEGVISELVPQLGYMNVTRMCEQAVALFIDPALHPYVYPPRAPSQGAALIRYTVPPEQAVIFQDADQRHVFYFIPDEFRLTRDDVTTPTFKPALKVDLFGINAADGGEVNDWGATLTFRAVPFMAGTRELDALAYIEQHKLVPDGQPVAWLPLIPEWTALQLTVPNDNGSGLSTVDRPNATVVFDQSVVDSVTMSSSAFTEVFNSMSVGGETLNGQVKYKLSRTAGERSVPLSGRLDKLVGPTLRAELVASSLDADGKCKVQLTNAIESPIVVKQLVVSVLDAPEGRWARATILSALPLNLAPAQSTELSVQVAGLAQAFAARVSHLQSDVALDFAALWLDVLDEPGWDDVIQDVTATVDPSYFTGERAIEQVSLTFVGVAEALVLSASKLSGTVRVARPLLQYLRKQPGADAYVYQLRSLRRATPGGELAVVAESQLISGNGPALPVVPPLP